MILTYVIDAFVGPRLRSQNRRRWCVLFRSRFTFERIASGGVRRPPIYFQISHIDQLPGPAGRKSPAMTDFQVIARDGEGASDSGLEMPVPQAGEVVLVVPDGGEVSFNFKDHFPRRLAVPPGTSDERNVRGGGRIPFSTALFRCLVSR